jgi:4-alpha-glucanotransferase
MLQQRSSGILLHITSLPSVHGVGDLGPEAYRFADFLQAAKQTYWQILPLTPVDPGAGFSPYSSPSAFAGNVLMISLEKLADDNFISRDHLDVFNEQPVQDVTVTEAPTVSGDTASPVLAGPLVLAPSTLHAAWIKKRPLLQLAAENFLNNATLPNVVIMSVFVTGKPTGSTITPYLLRCRKKRENLSGYAGRLKSFGAIQLPWLSRQKSFITILRL